MARAALLSATPPCLPFHTPPAEPCIPQPARMAGPMFLPQLDSPSPAPPAEAPHASSLRLCDPNSLLPPCLRPAPAESTVLTMLPVLAHHGLIFVPTGYSFGERLFDVSEVRGGTAYGERAAPVPSPS